MQICCSKVTKQEASLGVFMILVCAGKEETLTSISNSVPLKPSYPAISKTINFTMINIRSFIFFILTVD